MISRIIMNSLYCIYDPCKKEKENEEDGFPIKNAEIMWKCVVKIQLLYRNSEFDQHSVQVKENLQSRARSFARSRNNCATLLRAKELDRV